MGGLTAEDMAELTALDTLFMPDTATVTRTAPGTVNPDGSSEPGTVTTTTYPCRLVSLSGNEVLIAARVTAEANAILYLPLTADVQTTDTVAVAGVTYQIVDTNAGASYATSLQLTLRFLQ
jgi:hypothetical protein